MYSKTDPLVFPTFMFLQKDQVPHLPLPLHQLDGISSLFRRLPTSQLVYGNRRRTSVKQACLLCTQLDILKEGPQSNTAKQFPSVHDQHLPQLDDVQLCRLWRFQCQARA